MNRIFEHKDILSSAKTAAPRKTAYTASQSLHHIIPKIRAKDNLSGKKVSSAVLIGLFATKFGQAWRLAAGVTASEKQLHIGGGFSAAFLSPLPGFAPFDLLIGLLCGGILILAVFAREKNAKHFRHNVKYGSARWGKRADIVLKRNSDPGI